MRLIRDHDLWPRFLRLYGEVIHDGTLVLKNPSIKLRCLDHVSVHLEMAMKPLETAYGREVVFRVTWRCHGKDGGFGDRDVYFSFTEDPAMPTLSR